MKEPRIKKNKLGYFELVNKPTRQKLTSYYERQYYQKEKSTYRHEYTKDELKLIDHRIQIKYSKLLKLYSFKKQSKILDVGCGEGYVMKYFLNKGWDVSGIDFSLSAIKINNPQLIKLINIGDIFDLIDRIIISKKKYDVLWLGNVLEHVLSPQSLLIKLKKIIKKKGFLVVTVPNDISFYHDSLLKDKLISKRFWIAAPDHISYFSKTSLENIAKFTGWNSEGMMSDFPVNFFLSNSESNYINKNRKGKNVHLARIYLEKIISNSNIDNVISFYSSLANLELGRNLTAYLRPI